MIWRRTFRKRSRAEWAARVIAAASAAGLGYHLVSVSFAGTLSEGQLERAHRLAPNDAQISGLLSEQLSGPEANAQDWERASKLARTALLADATAAPAAITLGMSRLLHGDRVGFQRLLIYSQRLSRRNLRAQLLAIEDAVARDDVDSALEHYDIVLRTKRNASDLLFPVLAGASSDPVVRSKLIPRMAARPAWAPAFIDYLAVNGDDPGATAALFRGLMRARVPVSENASSALIGKLVAGDQFEDAWSYYAIVRPGSSRISSRDPKFAADLTVPSPFDWAPASDGGISTSIQQATVGGVFNFNVPASIGGVLLKQSQMLMPGRYTLSGHVNGLDQSTSSLLNWVLSCSDGRELGRVGMTGSATAEGRFAGELMVSADCPMQVLALVARPSDAVGGSTGQIDRVILERKR